MIETIFATLTSLWLATTMASEAIDKPWHLDGLAAQVRSLVIGALGGLFGAYMKWGMFSDPATCASQSIVLCGLVVGLAAGLIGNWSFASPIVQFILQFLKLRPKIQTPKT
jgi:hypothetical protein